MATASPNNSGKTTAKSEWGGLSDHLIATFYPVGYDGKRTSEESNGQQVQEELKAPLVDEANMDIALSWNSPFENTDIDNSAQSLAAMAQTGGFSHLSKLAGGIGEDLVKKMQGRTGITKLNSTQVFTGAPPIKFTVTLLFRAWDNPATEVEACLNMLMKWALPRKLADSGGWAVRGLAELSSAIANGTLKEADLDWVMPSQTPTLVAMQYKNRTYKPLVIESVGIPISSPVDPSGNFIDLKVPLTLATLNALDREDWRKL